MIRRALLLATVVALLTSAPAPAAGPTLRVGVGRADVTPVTGTFKGGWACSCAKAEGQHTRLFVRAVVLEQGGRKLALLNADLAFFGLGMLRDAVRQLPGRGYSEQNVIVAATHTHSSQAGFMNYATFNSVLPKFANLTDIGAATPTDITMYSFMTGQLAKAIARADDNLRPGALGWGRADLLGVTRNRSLEAHLAEYGVHAEVGKGRVEQAPGGYRDTVDPAVDVLRVDQYARAERVPVGMFSTFANHGTVVRPSFEFYSADHSGAASRVVEAEIRRIGKVPARQDVVNAFANSDAGDMSSGLDRSGPAEAETVGRREATAMLTAWRAAGRAMTKQPALGLRHTIQPMENQPTSEGPTDGEPVIGLGAAAGSEELRTIFYDAGLAREGMPLPLGVGAQGNKVPTLREKGSVAPAVPLTVMRIGDRMIATAPGEPTVGVGRMLRRAVLEQAGPGVKRVVLAGYANEYLDYWTTPAEYDTQHYEGGFTMYGRTASLVLRDTLAKLTAALVSGKPADLGVEYDANAGTHATAANYGDGAPSATIVEQPGATARLGHAALSWNGGAHGIDRPVDRAFVTVQRQKRNGRWRPVADDLGMQIAWTSDAQGRTVAQWEVPLSAPAASYRIVVSAKRYTLTSAPFAVTTGTLLTPDPADTTLQLRYPAARQDLDWTARPDAAGGGSIAFIVDGRRVVVRSHDSTTFAIPDGTTISIPAGGARDRYGNTSARAVTIR